MEFILKDLNYQDLLKVGEFMVKIERKKAFVPVSFWEKEDGTIDINLETEYGDAKVIVSPKIFNEKKLEKFSSELEKLGFYCDTNYGPFHRAVCVDYRIVLKIKK